MKHARGLVRLQGASQWSIVGLVLLALAIRARYLWTHHLWNDELSTMRVAKMPWSETFGYLTTIEPHPPASFLYMKVLNLLFANQLTIDQLKYGVLVWTVGIGAAALWSASRNPWFTVPIGAGLALVAVNPLFAYLGSETRPYSMLIAIAFALIVFSARWIAVSRSGGRSGPRLQWIMVLLLAMAAWTHYAGVLLSVSVVVAIGLISIVHRRKIDRSLALVALIAAALVSPAILILTSQISIDVSTAQTPLPEVVGYLGWGFGGLGLSLAVVLTAWSILRLPNTSRGDTKDSSVVSESRELVAVGWFSLIVVLLFILGAVITRWLTGVQLINIGTSIVPVLFAVVGLACLLSAYDERAVRWLIGLSLVVSLPIALIITDSPDMLRSNRIANVDILLEASRSASLDHDAGDRTMLISLDGSVSNQYFAIHAAEQLPAARVETILITQFDTRLGPTIEAAIQDQNIDRILLVTRYGFNYRVRPFLPPNIRVVQVHRDAWLLELVNRGE